MFEALHLLEMSLYWSRENDEAIVDLKVREPDGRLLRIRCSGLDGIVQPGNLKPNSRVSVEGPRAGLPEGRAYVVRDERGDALDLHCREVAAQQIAGSEERMRPARDPGREGEA